MSGFKRKLALVCGAVVVVASVAGVCVAGARHYALAVPDFVRGIARVSVTPVYALIHRDDAATVARLTAAYRVGVAGSRPARDGWKAIEGLRLTDASGTQALAVVPFVYENADSAYLAAFRDDYRLGEVIAGDGSEFDAMLRLGAWLGTRWDHGIDKVPGSRQVCAPSEVVAAGERGAKYWCEIAARTTVQAATALGWPARVITASRDGYTWEHAVAELWSNDFGKWFVLDTDFNVIYESAGVPLSALELSMHGEALQRAGMLTVRPIAPPKPSLPLVDMLPFYAYVHVDLRNDWCSRALPPGSPAGGDLATWWTARPDFRPVLTAMPRVDDPALFDWPVNDVAIHALGATRGAAGLELAIGLEGYSPVFAAFEWRVDGGDWQTDDDGALDVVLPAGAHVLEGRVLTRNGGRGPAARVAFEIG